MPTNQTKLLEWWLKRIRISKIPHLGLYSLGTVAQIWVLKMPDGNTTVIIQGKRRFEIQSITKEEPYLKASIKPVEETFPSKDNSGFKAIIDSAKDMALKIIHENPNIPSEASFAIKNIQSHAFLINFVSSNMNLPVREKQRVLSIYDLKDGAIESLKLMNVEYQKLELKNDIQSKEDRLGSAAKRILPQSTDENHPRGVGSGFF